MSKISQKHRSFVAEPMRDKRVTKIPGVGKALGERLTDGGYDKAFTLLGKYLSMNQNEELFQEWVKDTFQAGPKQSAECSRSLKEWCKEFL